MPITRFIVLLFSCFMGGFGQGVTTIDVPMPAITNKGWLKIMGTKDEAGRPVILDLSYTPLWNPHLLGETLGAQARIIMKRSGERDFRYGVRIARLSDGSGLHWYAHVPHSPLFTGEFTMEGQGFSGEPGAVSFADPGTPRLKLTEANNGMQWDVVEGWQVQVAMTQDDGESWTLLGSGNTGRASWTPTTAAETVVRIQAFRGLRGHASIFIPGRGVVTDPKFWLKPSYFVNYPGEQHLSMSLGPAFTFLPGVQNDFKTLKAKVKILRDTQKLPFKVHDIFNDKVIQMVFRAEWDIGKDDNPLYYAPTFDFDLDLIEHPQLRKDFALYQIARDKNGQWKALLRCKPVYYKHDTYSMRLVDEKNQNLGVFRVDWNSFWVLTSAKD